MKKCGALVIAAVLYLPGVLRADPVVVTGGVKTGGQEDETWSLTGSTFSFAVPGRPDLLGPDFLYIPKVYGPSCGIAPGPRCTPGEILDVSFSTPGEVSLGTGIGTIDGTAYSRLTFRGSLQFEAQPILLPATTAGMDVVLPGLGGSAFLYLSSPISFSGFLRAFDGDTEVFSRALTGTGRTQMPFYFYPENVFPPGWHWEDTEAFYLLTVSDPAPVPEPSTLVLVAIGAGVIGRVRARRRAAVRSR